MKTAFFSSHKFEHYSIAKANHHKHELVFIEDTLSKKTIPLAQGCQAICIFVNDKTDALVLRKLKEIGIKFIALRSAGFNHVALVEAEKLGIKIARVPEYSPFSVAEHAMALMMALNRKLVHAHNRINELNFSLDGLVGFDMNGKTVGIVGTGKIGQQMAKILYGFGCKILAYDQYENENIKKDFGVTYVSLNTLFSKADIISLHLPLSSETKYIIDEKSIRLMKKGVMLINTGKNCLFRNGCI